MIRQQRFSAEGTTCKSCERIIIKQAQKVQGVEDVTFDWTNETGIVTYDTTMTDIDTILDSIEEKGYTCSIIVNKPSPNYWWLPTIAGILVIGFFLLRSFETLPIPDISQGMGYTLLFIVGLITGFHCISMCGGFVVSYTSKGGGAKSHILYGAGKTLSYSIIGALFGLLGSFIAFTPMLRGTAGILAGIFLVIYGLKMLNIIPGIRKFGIRLPKGISRKISGVKTKSPMVIGLLNGLMIACGPLQAIYILAAGTGSMAKGALSLLAFGLGTLPVMIGFGLFASFISKKSTQKLLKVSGAIVILLGVIMLNNGLTLTGKGYDIGAMLTSVKAEDTTPPDLKEGFQEIRMSVVRSGFEPDTFTLQRGIPVKWVIDGKEITGCNNAIQVPEYGLSFDVKPGEQVIEFTPEKKGIIRWSCWMGMIPGTFIVIDDPSEEEELKAKIPPRRATGTCGCGG